jgi:hypothetical protein
MTSAETKCQEAVAQLDKALDAAPKEVIEHVRQAAQATVQVRDGMIDQLRTPLTIPRTKELHARLDRVNTALSCIAGVEYPSGGIHHKLLKQARKALKELLSELPP